MIKTKDINVDIGGSKYQISVDFEQDGNIIAIVIDGDCMELLSYSAEMIIVDEFNRDNKDER